ncbi:hypothetical protein DFH27DRAFT_285844 [Peziza echinospora]|nr:hypothetical protein DFH27DRAFT_285844 [Peziza echinospora]
MAASEQSQQLAQIQKEKEGLLSRIKTLDAVNQELIAIKTKNSMLTTSLEEQKKRREELKVALDSAKKLQDEALEKCGLLNTKLADDRVKYIERENELKQKLVEEKVELERIVALERNNVIILRKELEHLNSLPREDPASKQMLLELQFKVSSLETEKLSLQARVKDVEAREESKQTRIDNLTSTYDSLKEKYDQNTEKLQLLNNEKTALENTLSNLQSAHKKEMSEALKKAKEQYIAERIQVERNATTLLALARGERDQAIETRDKIQKELQQLLQSNELNEKEYARYKLTNDNLAESNRGLTERNTQLKAEVVALQEEKEAVSQARDQLKRELREAEEKIYSEALKSNQQKIEDAEEFKKLELNFKMVRMECDKLSKRFIDSQAQLQKLQSELDISRNTLQDRNSVATTLETKTLELNQALEACKRHWAFVVDLLFETHENKPLEINPGFEEVVMRLRLVLSHKALVTAPQESKTPHGNSGQNPAAAPVTPSVEVNGGTSNLVPAVTPLLINYDISCLQGEEPPTSSPLSPVPSNVSELALLGFPKNKELSMLPPAQFELPATPKYRVGDKEGSSVTVEVPQSSDLGLASSTTGNAGSDPIAPAMIPSTIVSGTSPISSRVKRGRAQAGDTEGVGNGGSSSSASHKVSLGKEMTSPSTKRKHTYKAPGEDRTSSTHLSKRVRKERDSETSRAEHRPDVQRTPKKGSSTLGDRHETHNNVREADVHHESPSRHASAGSKKLLSRAKARRG